MSKIGNRAILYHKMMAIGTLKIARCLSMIISPC